MKKPSAILARRPPVRMVDEWCRADDFNVTASLWHDLTRASSNRFLDSICVQRFDLMRIFWCRYEHLATSTEGLINCVKTVHDSSFLVNLAYYFMKCVAKLLIRCRSCAPNPDGDTNLRSTSDGPLLSTRPSDRHLENWCGTIENFVKIERILNRIVQK